MFQVYLVLFSLLLVVSTSEISYSAWKDKVTYCVEWDVKLYSLTQYVCVY